jgi:RNA polymerase sigma-70 factor (ECF subfamily)
MDDERGDDARTGDGRGSRGDARELTHRLFTRYRRPIVAFFTTRGFSPEDSADLTQEVFVRVFQNIDSLRSEGAVEFWLRRIVANTWKNELRRRGARKREGTEVSLDGELEGGDEALERAVPVGAAEARSALEAALTAEELAAAQACLDELSPRVRECLELHVVDEHAYRDIAKLLHISLETVKSHIHQAREKVRECMARRLEAGGA